MKVTITAMLALAGATTVVANDFPDNMPECGKICGTNMLAKAAEFGCANSDIACLCKNKDFGYGIHDCSVQACSSVDQANAAIEWGINLCSSASAPANIATATAVATHTQSSSGASGSPVSTSEVVSTITTGGSTVVTTSVSTVSASETESSKSGDATPITTSTWTSVVTSGSVTSTITGETTISGISGVAGATSIPETTLTAPIVSTKTEESSTFETTVGSTTLVSSVTGGALTSALNSQASVASSKTSSGQGAHMTAAPALGVLAAAGLAAALL